MENKAITIFGGSGDLSYRKLLPALYNLESLGKLEQGFRIVCIGRRDYTAEDYLEIAGKWIKDYARQKYDESVFKSFSSKLLYFKMDFTDINEYNKLQLLYDELEILDHIYYFAVAPSFFSIITVGLSTFCSLSKSKVIVEKPFGKDLESADRLNKYLRDFFGEEHIYHIDHYLGKEMIQNILSIRFKNAVFSGIWNKDFIESIEISAHETVGVGTRAAYYDNSGALKDMVQNHLFQVLSIVAMEDPALSDISAEQLKLLKSLKPVGDVNKQLVLAQYEGYLQENGVAKDSKTETFAALKLYIDNTRWEGVPFIIRTGKELSGRDSQLVVTFKSLGSAPKNVLLIKIQPDEGVYFRFNIKKPGSEQDIEEVSMDFCQSCILENRINTPEAYERLIEACMSSDRTLFSKWEQIVVSWHFMDELIDKARKANLKIHTYEKGTHGPEAASILYER